MLSAGGDITDEDLRSFVDFVNREQAVGQLRVALVQSFASNGVYGVSEAVARNLGWERWRQLHPDIKEVRVDDTNSYLDYDVGDDDDAPDEVTSAASDHPWTPFAEVLRIEAEYGGDCDIRYI